MFVQSPSINNNGSIFIGESSTFVELWFKSSKHLTFDCLMTGSSLLLFTLCWVIGFYYDLEYFPKLRLQIKCSFSIQAVLYCMYISHISSFTTLYWYNSFKQMSLHLPLIKSYNSCFKHIKKTLHNFYLGNIK